MNLFFYLQVWRCGWVTTSIKPTTTVLLHAITAMPRRRHNTLASCLDDLHINGVDDDEDGHTALRRRSMRQFELHTIFFFFYLFIGYTSCV
jgi:hypothetical protein